MMIAPGVLSVPPTTVSPTSALRTVTVPEIGLAITVFSMSCSPRSMFACATMIEPSIAFLGPNALVVWSDQAQPSPFNYDIASTTLDLHLCTRCSGFEFQGLSYGGRQHRSIATSRLAANPAALRIDASVSSLSKSERISASFPIT